MGMSIWQPRFGSSFGFHYHMGRHFDGISDGCEIGSLDLDAES